MHISATAANDVTFQCDAFVDVHDTSPTTSSDECPSLCSWVWKNSGANALHVYVCHENMGCKSMLGAHLSVFSPSPKLPYLPQPHAYNCTDIKCPVRGTDL